MKRFLQLCLFSAVVASAISCSQPKEWTEQQRAEFFTYLDPYRQMIYLSEMTDPEFMLFTGDISTEAEEAYPVYTNFIVMPALSDTLDMWVVTSIVEQLDADAENMRYLYPYRTLIEQGVLPEGMDHRERMSFYSCFADKVDNHFESLEGFFFAVITNSLDQNIITEMQKECAAEFSEQ